MLIRRVRLASRRRQVDIYLSQVTVLAGSRPCGKTLLLKTLHRVLTRIGDLDLHHDEKLRRLDILLDLELPGEVRERITQYFYRTWHEDLSFWSGRLQVSISISDDRTEYVFKMPEVEEPILQLVSHSNVIRLRRPVELDLERKVSSVSGLRDLIERTPEASVISETEKLVRATLDLVVLALRYVRDEIDIVYMGPYIDYNTCVETVQSSDRDNIHGESTVLLLLRLIADPRHARKVLSYMSLLGRRAGIGNLSVGLVENKLTLVLQEGDELIVCPELPCSVKTSLALIAQLLALRKYSLVLLENLDYCYSSDTFELVRRVLAECVRDKQCQIVAECRSQEVIAQLTNLGDVVSVVMLE